MVLNMPQIIYKKCNINYAFYILRLQFKEEKLVYNETMSDCHILTPPTFYKTEFFSFLHKNMTEMTSKIEASKKNLLKNKKKIFL